MQGELLLAEEGCDPKAHTYLRHEQSPSSQLQR